MILKSPIPLSNSNSSLQLKHPNTQTSNKNVPHKILILANSSNCRPCYGLIFWGWDFILLRIGIAFMPRCGTLQ